MMLKKEELEKLAARHQAKADRAYQDYQATGITRYDRERRNNEDLADAFRAAANAAEEHQELGHLRGEVVYLASRADKAIHYNAERDELVTILNDLICYASVCCKYKKMEDTE